MELSRALIMLLLFVAGLACGRFGGAWIDGTYVKRTDADLIAQGRVDEAARTAVLIKSATDAKEAALKRVQAPARIVSYECPPGQGAVSSEALKRLREATMLQFK